MNWSNSELYKLTYNIDTPHSSEQLKLMRGYCKKHSNSICAYCGGVYKKTFACLRINENTFKPCCQLCQIITQFKPKYSPMIVICRSTMSQLEIIRSTVDYIHSHKKAPPINIIDKNAVYANEHPIHFFNAFCKSSADEKKVVNHNFKLFYTNYINITNITLGIVNNSSDFSNFILESEEQPNIVSKEIVLQKDITMQRITNWCSRIYQLNKEFADIDSMVVNMMLSKYP